MEASCNNPLYEDAFSRMLGNLATLYASKFLHKAGYMATHDWRPRELNRTADRLCNIALDTKNSFRIEYVPELAAKLREGVALQVFSDGGLRDDEGASAYAVYIVHTREGSRLELALVDAIYLREQESAFAMEVVAADRAIQEITLLLSTL